MSANHARNLDLPLAFLGSGQYLARVWKDAPDAESSPNHLTTDTVSVSSDDTLKLHIAVDGGFVVRLMSAGN